MIAAEVQTTLVDSFSLQGFAQPVTVYRVEQRHRTRIIANAYILFCDLRGFVRVLEAESWSMVERVLDQIDTLTSGVARDFGGTIRSNLGDSYWVTYPDASQVMAAAERLGQDWAAMDQGEEFKCAINIVVHRGTIRLFRSFLFSKGMSVAERVHAASAEVLVAGEGGIFVTGEVRDNLSGSPWYGRLEPIALKAQDQHFPGLDVYRLVGASAQ